MTKLYDLPDLLQLKEWKTYDQTGYEALVKMLGSHKKVLILANKNAGKNTVQNSIVNFIHRTHEETLVIPSLEGVKINKMNSNKKINELKKMCKNQKSFVAAIQYDGNHEVPVSEYVGEFSGWFDCVLDLRNVEGQRILCGIYAGKKSFKCVYKHHFIKSHLVAA
ncbi:MAG: hypothetical protein ACXVLQ_17860 [Bacteriovorax sp.]